MLKTIISFLLVVFSVVSIATTIASAKTINCTAVVLRAEMVYSPDVVTVGVFSDKEKQLCRFTVNAMPNIRNNILIKKLKTVVLTIRFLQDFSKTSGEESRQKFATAIKSLSDDFIYLLGAPGLEEGGSVPKKLDKIVAPQRILLEDCFGDFYTGGTPFMKGTALVCETLGKSKDTLETTVWYDRISYSLYTFR